MSLTSFIFLFSSLFPIDLITGEYLDCHRTFYATVVTINSKSSSETHCEGSLIGPQWLLSSANCLYEHVNKPQDLIVTVPTTKKTNNVVTVFIHSKFDPKTFDNDIAMAFIPPKQGWLTNVVYTKLVENYTDDSGSDFDHIQFGKSMFKKIEDCKKHFTTGLLPDERKYLCATPPKVDMLHKCFEYSGAPLECNGVQIGVASWGKCNGAYVYTSVVYYWKFMIQVVLRSANGNNVSEAQLGWLSLTIFVLSFNVVFPIVIL